MHHHADNWGQLNEGHLSLRFDEIANITHQLPISKPNATFNYCTDHKKPQEIFCETCQQVVCHLCTEHAEHSYDNVDNAFKKHVNVIKECNLQLLVDQIDQLTKNKEDLIQWKEEILQNANIAKEDVQCTITYLKRLLDDAERKLSGDLDIALQHKVSVLDHQIKEVETALGQVRECRDHVEQSLKVGTPQDILSLKSQMMSRTEIVISCVNEKTFQPLEEADFELVKSNNIEEVCQNIGEIKCSLFVGKMEKISHNIPLSSKEFSVVISLTDYCSIVPNALINCTLTPPETSSIKTVPITLEESKVSGQYVVVFTSDTRVLYQLHFRVKDMEIPGSPVSIPVSVPLG